MEESNRGRIRRRRARRRCATPARARTDAKEVGWSVRMFRIDSHEFRFESFHNVVELKTQISQKTRASAKRMLLDLDAH